MVCSTDGVLSSKITEHLSKYEPSFTTASLSFAALLDLSLLDIFEWVGCTAAAKEEASRSRKLAIAGIELRRLRCEVIDTLGEYPGIADMAGGGVKAAPLAAKLKQIAVGSGVQGAKKCRRPFLNIFGISGLGRVVCGCMSLPRGS